MGNLNEIKVQLDNYYQEYKDNKNTLNGGKTKAVAQLVTDIMLSKDGSLHDVAVELARFSAEVSVRFFEDLTKVKTLPLHAVEDILSEFLATDTEAKLSQYYVSKFAPAIVSTIKCYKEESYHSSILPKLVEFIAGFAAKSDRNKSKFYNLINNSAGEIFLLDYSNISKKSLINIWNVINSIYPDLTKAKYEHLITEWGKKYGIIKTMGVDASVKQDSSANIERSVVSKQELTEAGKPVKKKNSASADKPLSALDIKADTSSKDNSDPPTALDKAHTRKSTDKAIYESIKSDINKEQEAIITAFTGMISPIGKMLESIKGEINKSREIGIENESLKAKIAHLEDRLFEQKAEYQAVNQSLMAAKTENDELKSRILSLESQISDLDNKLNDVYKINSRESSLEAEKVRSELKKAFAFLYEDWLEYEFSDVSEENYESLQAIIKKIFRSLERNGIDFKGNN